ncbi:Probable aspartic protease At2g35615 [Linum perenne]
MSPYSPLQFFLFIISTLIFSTSHGFNITIPLIHRDSIYSPLYNATETIEDRAQRVAKASLDRRIAKASLDRYEYLSSALSIRPEANLVPGFKSHLFFINFSIGTPWVPQLALMDTASAFLWVKCKPCSPCDHGPKDPPIFDPANSRTIYEVPCEEKCEKCTEKEWSLWSDKKRCKYTIDYVDGRVSEGTYVTEKLTFQTSNNDKSKVSVPNILFGCSTYTTVRGHKVMDKHFSGIIGLGPVRDPKAELGYPSLVSDLGNKFSYCTGRLSDRYYPYNQISFGDKSHLIGLSTPFNVDTGYYFVNLVNISLGGQVIYVFQTMSNNRGILIDSGAELNYLSPGALDAVNAEVRKLAAVRKWEEVRVPVKFPYELCYKGSVYREARDFPPIGIQFIGEGKLVLDNFGMFKQVEDDKFCLAFLRTDSISLIGMLAQQGYNIGYDLLGERLYIKDIDCQTV